MILARWKGEWVLAGRAYPAHSDGSFAVSVRNKSPYASESHGFQPYPYGSFWSRQFYTPQDFAFYPEISFRGVRVAPKGWHRDSEEPLALCHMEPHHLVSDGDTKRYMRLVEEMKSQGWEWDIREGGDAYIHVDDLEKIKGPPPEGAF